LRGDRKQGKKISQKDIIMNYSEFMPQHCSCHPSSVSGLVIMKKTRVDEALQRIAGKEIKKLI